MSQKEFTKGVTPGRLYPLPTICHDTFAADLTSWTDLQGQIAQVWKPAKVHGRDRQVAQAVRSL